MNPAVAMTLPLLMLATHASAAEISTHVLDLTRGVGGRDVPVTLSKQTPAGAWVQVAGAKTDGNGRIRSFGDNRTFDPGTYRLQFDMSAYPDQGAAPFFPEIVLTFRIADPNGHYHVPIVVSPYGYSTYRGN